MITDWGTKPFSPNLLSKTRHSHLQNARHLTLLYHDLTKSQQNFNNFKRNLNSENLYKFTRFIR